MEFVLEWHHLIHICFHGKGIQSGEKEKDGKGLCVLEFF